MEGRVTQAVVSLDAIARNLLRVREQVGKGVQIIAVVKADAYGHGALPVSQILTEAGAEWLGVALPEEGACLRRQGISVPILVMGPSPPDRAPLLLEYHLDQMVYSLSLAQRLSTFARGQRKRIGVHLKVDTGMGRVGVHPAEATATARAITHLPGVAFKGVMTHFAAADAVDKSHAQGQLQQFLSAIEEMKAAGIAPPLRHAANSAAILDLREAHLDAVRPGIVLYGYPPSRHVSQKLSWEPAMVLKSCIAQIKKVPRGGTVSYGCTFTAPRDIVVATLPVGYADGYNRLLSNRGEVLIRGTRAPVVGQVCMDMIIVDVTGLGGVQEGEEVVLMGTQGGEALWADRWAEYLQTIPYEVLCNISRRVPRTHLWQGRPLSSPSFTEVS
jgi:alanine racemase